MGRLLQILGCVLMLAAVCAAVGGADRADAEILAPIARAIQAALTRSCERHTRAQPTPTPAPRPRPRQRGGPSSSTFPAVCRSADNSKASAFGQNVIFTPSPSPNASSTPGPFPFQQGSQTSENQAELGAGLTADISRAVPRRRDQPPGPVRVLAQRPVEHRLCAVPVLDTEVFARATGRRSSSRSANCSWASRCGAFHS